MSYKSILLKGIFWAVCIWFSVNASAIPAKPGKIQYELPNGEIIDVLMHGDENGYYYTTLDGYVLTRGTDGYFRYMISEGDQVKESSMIAANVERRSSDENAFVKSLNKAKTLSALENQHRKSGMKSKIKPIVEPKTTTYPTTGVQKGVAILVEFSNNSFTLTNPRQQFYDQLNKHGYNDSGATGSVKDYFMESSNGQFIPEFDVFGPVKLSRPYSYYGEDTKSMIDEKAFEMVIEACTLLDSQIDFSQYDRDEDGLIDNVYIFYAGYGQADGGAAETVWPHSWDVIDAGRTFYYDGVRLGHYACSSELRDGRGSKISGIGVFCHEFSHVLGLPDLYAVSYNGSFTPGAWSLMDSGSYNNDSWTPPYMSGYERYALGWVEPKVLEEPANVTLKHITESKGFYDVYMIKTDKKDEYFIFENKQLKGWDAYLPGHGMLAWHIDYNETVWDGNVVNNTPSHQYVDIEEADNDPSYYSIPGDAFPGTANVTSFTDETSPSMKSWAGVSLYAPITDIKESEAGEISFVFRGGVDIFGEIIANEATNIGADKATVSWSTTTNASAYLLSVYEKTETGEKKYVEGYSFKNVGNVSTTEITGLYPLTTYYYVVYATNGQFNSKASNEVELKTGEPTLNYLKVTALDATNVTGNGFTANWVKLAEADYYTLTVYTSQLGAPDYEVLDFTGKLEALPSNWSTSCTGTYGLKPYCGESAPSLKMDADKAFLQSPVFKKGLRSLRFWYRGNNAAAQNALKVYALKGTEWEEIYNICPISNEAGGQIVELEIDRKYTSVKWEYSRQGTGNIALDDIKIGHSGEMEELPVLGYTDIAVGDVNSYAVSGLAANTLYAYDVKGYNDEFTSIVSDRISVKLGESSAVEDLSNNGDAVCWVVDGQVYVKSADKCQVHIMDCSGRTLYIGEQTQQIQSYEVGASGVIIVRVNGKSCKVIL